MKPGCTKVTFTPSGFSSYHSDSLAPSRANLLALYDDIVGMANIPLTEDTLMILPRPTRRMWGRTNRIRLMGPR